MFLCFGLGPSCRVLRFSQTYVPIYRGTKNNVDIFSHILNLISLKRGFSLFLA